MKLRPTRNSTHPLISKQDDYFECITECHINDQLCNEKCVNTLKNEYVHPWYNYVDKLNKPNPPSQQSVDKAKFVDKTYHWSRDDSVRPRNKRSAK